MSAPYLGSHLSLCAPEFYLGTCEKAVSLHENAFMFYTGAPQNTRRSPTSSLRIPEGRAFLKAHDFDESKIVVHAPYIINLGNKANGDIYLLAQQFLSQEIKRVQDFGLSLLVLHPGSSVGASKEFGIASVSEGLNNVLKDVEGVTICLETMAGKGSELGSNFEELAAIFARLDHPERCGVCLDTCHINDAGMDVSKPSEILDHFDQILGLSRLKVIHLNDSKNERGSHKDRHENIGYGTIGFPVLSSWVEEPRLQNVPKILETPAFEEKETWGKEVEMLRNGHFEAGWREAL
jgi:deoxyribonuclease-4